MKSAVLYPLLFEPIFQERIWGGRNLERVFQKRIPAGPIGESWEISDRPEAESRIANGPLAGKTLHWVLEHHRHELMGDAKTLKGRFPLLVKILDAEEKLSLQVHPPEHKAEALKGEPKTEMWYIVKAQSDAKLYVGLRRGVTREEFRKKTEAGTVAECFHQVEVQSGDTMFLPSGRVHAIGAGLLIFEIQQNSDTTYRVFDWNRKDGQGKSRQLHVKESLECINFDDFEPEVIRHERAEAETSNVRLQTLVENPLFTVELVSTMPNASVDYALRAPRVIGVVEGELQIEDPAHPVRLTAGQFCLLPAGLHRAKILAQSASRFLVAQPG